MHTIIRIYESVRVCQLNTHAQINMDLKIVSIFINLCVTYLKESHGCTIFDNAILDLGLLSNVVS